MMQAHMPPTPLALAMWKWSPSLDPLKTSLSQIPTSCFAAKQLHGHAYGSTISQLDGDDTHGAKRPAAETREESSQPIEKRFSKFVPGQGGRKYQSIDPKTGRVWGAPNAGGRAQCSECPGMAMSTSTRCEVCWRALSEKDYTPMGQCELAEVQLFFDKATELKKLPERQLADTKQRLEFLRSQLKCGKICPDIQTNLLLVARAIAEKRFVEAKKLLSRLSTKYWEMHKDWLVVVQRLLSMY
jgi:hypothetical protein